MTSVLHTPLLDPNGSNTSLAALGGGPMLVQLVRYYG